MTAKSRACGRCGYCLDGLPEAHRCPECGLAYDQHTRTWCSPSSLGRALRLWVMIGMLLAAAWAVGTALPTFNRFPRRQAVAHGLLLLMAVTCARSLVRARHRAMVLADCTGVKIEFGLRPPRTIPWREIASVDCSGALRCPFVRIRLANNHRELDVSPAFHKAKDAEEFAEFFRKRRASLFEGEQESKSPALPELRAFV